VVEHGVSVHYTLQSAIVWEEARHEWVKIVISLDPVEAVMSWQLQEGPVRRLVSEPHVWVMPAGILHRVEWRGTTGLVVIYLEPTFLRQICEADVTVVRTVDLRVLARIDLLIGELTEKFRELCHGRLRASPTLVQALGTVLVAQILKAQPLGELRPRKRKAGLSPERLLQVLNHIEAHLRDKLSQRVLARKAHLSEFHFARMFRLSTQFSPREYVMRRRVLHARELLLSGRLKVAAVAAEVGFCDQSHLNRHFIRVLGCAPSSIVPGIEHDDP
jgi:AraC family transcriptional regulator